MLEKKIRNRQLRKVELIPSALMPALEVFIKEFSSVFTKFLSDLYLT